VPLVTHDFDATNGFVRANVNGSILNPNDISGLKCLFFASEAFLLEPFFWHA
jgi:hypothetical protein